MAAFQFILSLESEPESIFSENEDDPIWTTDDDDDDHHRGEYESSSNEDSSDGIISLRPEYRPNRPVAMVDGASPTPLPSSEFLSDDECWSDDEYSSDENWSSDEFSSSDQDSDDPLKSEYRPSRPRVSVYEFFAFISDILDVKL
ncbi:hypothetical protein AVEN_77215-1 [Araneus ventricosus]|uniref:Uncharacterized protein n=1 Tax=Araneus ventricosus TaxID=182803 RepID=A0A4Y2QGL3_ARAVE|nr:hypothetical protein AVEN_77215-1 [Araneus ventricosus]